MYISQYIVQAQPNIVCPRVQSVDMSTTYIQIADPNKAPFTEISGLGFSPAQIAPSGKPILYVMNDGGGGRRFGVYDSGTGLRLKSLRMPRSLAENLDYESVSVGSCGIEDFVSCIYIFDVGDNQARGSGGTRTGHANRTAYPIYKIREPDVNDFGDNDILPESYVATLHFNYFHPTSPTQYSDCEAAFVDNTGWGGGSPGDLYLVTKWSSRSTNTRLFKIPATAWKEAKQNSDFVYSPEAIGYYSRGVNSNAISGHRWTRAEMTFDGTLIALGDYYDQYLYLRCPGMSVSEALVTPTANYCESWPAAYWDSQFEALAWSPDGASMLEISECTSSYCHPRIPMVFTTMDYTYNPERSVYCETVPTETPSLQPSRTPSISPMPSVSSAPTSTCSTILRGRANLFPDRDPRYICSPNGVFRFGFGDNGDLGLWRNDTKIWSAEPCCQATAVTLAMQHGDANLVLYGNIFGQDMAAIWSSRTTNINYSGSYLVVKDYGQAVIEFNGTEIWSTNAVGSVPTAIPSLQPSQNPSISPMPSMSSAPTRTCSSTLQGRESLFAGRDPSFICSPNGIFRFGLGDDSKLALWQNDTKVWLAEQCCKATEVTLAMQHDDANLVLYGNVVGEGTKPIWESGTANSDYSGAVLVVKDYGQVIIEFNGIEIWSTNADSAAIASGEAPPPMPTPRPTTKQTTLAPTRMSSCQKYVDKDLCKERGCKWKGGACMKKNQMR